MNRLLRWLILSLLPWSAASSSSGDLLRVLVAVEPSPLTYVAGYANRFQALLSYLVHVDADVEVVTAECVHPDPPKLYLGRVPIHYSRGFRFPWYRQLSLAFDWTGVLWRRVHAFRPQILHATTPGLLWVPTLIASRFFGIPLVLSYHTHLPVYCRSYLHPFISRVAEWVIWKLLWLVHSCGDVTLVTSPQIQDELEEHGIPSRVWPKGIDTDRFHPSFRNETLRESWLAGQKEYIVLYVGRMAAEKRLLDLVPILERLPVAQLVMVGDGPQRKQLSQSLAHLNPLWLGTLSGDALSQAYASADVFVLPSDSETLGFVVLESLASGVPVVACNAGGVPDLIQDGVTGYLIERGNESRWIERIDSLGGNPDLRASMGKLGRDSVAPFTWNSSMERVYREFYVEAREKAQQRWWGRPSTKQGAPDL